MRSQADESGSLQPELWVRAGGRRPADPVSSRQRLAQRESKSLNCALCLRLGTFQLCEEHLRIALVVRYHVRILNVKVVTPRLDFLSAYSPGSLSLNPLLS